MDIVSYSYADEAHTRLNNLSAGNDYNPVASGTLTNGDQVVLNTDGTVEVLAGSQSSQSEDVGSEVVFNLSSTQGISSTFDSTNNKVIVAYRDEGNSSYGTAIVGTVSGNSISFGSPTVFNTSYTVESSLVYDSTNNKVILLYRDGGNSFYGTAIVGTVSGNSISFGSPTVFNTATTFYISSTFDSANNKVIVAYKDIGNSSYGTAVVGTVSGTSISFGSEVVFNTANTSYISSVYDTSNNKVIVAYKDGGNSDYGTAVVGAVSGTSISFESPTVFNTATTVYISSTFDSANNKVIVAYNDIGNSSYGTAVVGTVSGTSISFGSEVVFNTANTSYISSVYDTSNNKVIVAYKDGGNSDYGTAVVGAVSGTSISFESPTVFKSGNPYGSATVYDTSNNKAVIVYQDIGNSSYGTAVVYQPAGVTITSNADKFIGYANEDASDTENVSALISGKVVSGLTGLTQGVEYYLDYDGTLVTSATPYTTSPIGIALSATELLLKGAGDAVSL